MTSRVFGRSFLRPAAVAGVAAWGMQPDSRRLGIPTAASPAGELTAECSLCKWFRSGCCDREFAPILAHTKKHRPVEAGEPDVELQRLFSETGFFACFWDNQWQYELTKRRLSWEELKELDVPVEGEAPEPSFDWRYDQAVEAKDDLAVAVAAAATAVDVVEALLAGRWSEDQHGKTRCVWEPRDPTELVEPSDSKRATDAANKALDLAKWAQLTSVGQRHLALVAAHHASLAVEHASTAYRRARGTVDANSRQVPRVRLAPVHSEILALADRNKGCSDRANRLLTSFSSTEVRSLRKDADQRHEQAKAACASAAQAAAEDLERAAAEVTAGRRDQSVVAMVDDATDTVDEALHASKLERECADDASAMRAAARAVYQIHKANMEHLSVAAALPKVNAAATSLEAAADFAEADPSSPDAADAAVVAAEMAEAAALAVETARKVARE